MARVGQQVGLDEDRLPGRVAVQGPGKVGG